MRGDVGNVDYVSVGIIVNNSSGKCERVYTDYVSGVIIVNNNSSEKCERVHMRMLVI